MLYKFIMPCLRLLFIACVLLAVNVHAQTDAPPQLLIRVLDTGPGIPQHLLSSVGDLFVTTKAQGTGLGLAVVNAVARAHRGKFYLQSKVGQGTCASLVMPLAELH